MLEVLDAVEENLEKSEFEDEEMPSFNHSYICLELLLQLSQNPNIKPLPELTLNIDNGLTPDISVLPREKVKPDFWEDLAKYPEMPILAIEIVSPSQPIQLLLDKAKILIRNNVKAVWIVEPFTKSIVVITKESKKAVQNQEVESEGIKVDFRKIFGES